MRGGPVKPKKKKRTAQQIGKLSRNKGKVAEREVANMLKLYYPDAARSFGQARNGDETPDVVGTPFWVEVTAGASPNLLAKLEQALLARLGSPQQARWASAPVIVFANCQKRKKRVVLMEEFTFQALLNAMLGVWPEAFRKGIR